MAESRVKSILNFLSGGADRKIVSHIEKTANKSTQSAIKSSLYSNHEREKLFRNVINAKQNNQTTITEDQLFNYAMEISESINFKSRENRRIIDMIPEVRQAKEIIVPLIISPNDMRDTNIPLVFDTTLVSEDKLKDMNKWLTNIFNDDLKLRRNAPKWLEDMLYYTGSKCILVIPASELDKHFNTKSNFTSFSDTNFTAKMANESILGFDKNFDKVQEIALESIVDPSIMQIDTNLFNKEDKYSSQEELTNSLANAYKSIYYDICSTESVQILDNLDILKEGKQNDAAAVDILKKTATYYKTSLLVGFNTPEITDEHYGQPLIIEWPSESVIPIFAPKNPEEHLGYLLLVDPTDGSPLSNDPHTDTIMSPNLTSNNKRQMSFDQLAKAYGYSDFRRMDQSTGTKLVTNAYRHIMEQHVKARLKTVGFSNLSLSMNNSITQMMLMRYLEGRMTRLIYAPKELLIYGSFLKDPITGVGVSQIEAAKFIISLRLVLLVCYTLSAINNSIDRKKITVNLNGKVVGNALELLETIERTAISKDSISINSMEPNVIMQNLARKAISMEVTGLPGLENYNVSSEPIERRSTLPDNEHIEDVKNLLLMMLDIAPAMVNMTSEAEFSRSVATMNLIVASKTYRKQNIFSEFLEMYVQTVLLFDKTMQDKIKEFITAEMVSSKKEDEDVIPSEAVLKQAGTVYDKNTDMKTVDFQLLSLIKSVKVKLAQPCIAPDQAQLEQTNNLISAATSIVDLILPDDLAGGNSEIGEALTAFRSHLRGIVVKECINKTGAAASIDIPEIINPEALVDILKNRQFMQNMKKSLDDQSAALATVTPSKNDDDGSSESGSYF